MSTNSHGLNDVKTSWSLVQIIVMLYLYYINDLRMQEKIVPREKNADQKITGWNYIKAFYLGLFRRSVAKCKLTENTRVSH